jgi:hypothetical protein
MKKITVEISAEFGSEFQQTFFLKTLKVMLNALKMHMDESHSKNKMGYTIDTHDGYKVTKVK